jgi:hypothetical protein
MVTIEIVQDRGNYMAGTSFEVDEQVARQLVAEGTARVVERVKTTDLVTDAVPSNAKGKKAAKQ